VSARLRNVKREKPFYNGRGKRKGRELELPMRASWWNPGGEKISTSRTCVEKEGGRPYLALNLSEKMQGGVALLSWSDEHVRGKSGPSRALWCNGKKTRRAGIRNFGVGWGRKRRGSATKFVAAGIARGGETRSLLFPSNTEKKGRKAARIDRIRGKRKKGKGEAAVHATKEIGVLARKRDGPFAEVEARDDFPFKKEKGKGRMAELAR